MPRQTVRDLLAEYTALLNQYGVDSREAQDYLDAHRSNKRFTELADLSRILKVALTAPTAGSPCPDHVR